MSLFIGAGLGRFPFVRIGASVDQSRVKTPSTNSAKTLTPVPLLDLSRQYGAIREEVLAAIERVCSSQQYILGAEAEALEGEIAAFTGAAAAVGCASGTDAL